MTQEFRSSFRLLLQTTELLVGSVFPLLLLLLTCRRCVLFFDVVEKKLFSVHTVSENFSPFFNDGLDMRMENFSCRHSLHIFSPGACGFTFFIISHLMLKSAFFFFNYQMWSLRVVVVLSPSPPPPPPPFSLSLHIRRIRPRFITDPCSVRRILLISYIIHPVLLLLFFSLHALSSSPF